MMLFDGFRKQVDSSTGNDDRVAREIGLGRHCYHFGAELSGTDHVWEFTKSSTNPAQATRMRPYIAHITSATIPKGGSEHKEDNKSSRIVKTTACSCGWYLLLEIVSQKHMGHVCCMFMQDAHACRV